MRSLFVLALLAMGVSSFAQTYHPRHDGDQVKARAHAGRGQDRAGKPSVFVAAIDRTIHACSQQSIELRGLPVDVIARSAQLRGSQHNALEEVRRSAAAAAKALEAACPSRSPAELTAKIDALDATLSLLVDSLIGLRPALATFFDLLDDEQKARLVIINLSSTPTSSVVERGARKKGDLDSNADAGAVSICMQWAANLRSWPVRQIEARMRFSDEQYAALYDLTAAIYRSAGDLVAACPMESPVTPIARLDAKEHELQSVRQDIEAIRPFARAFESALNEMQRKQLAQEVEVSQGGDQVP
jgi:hypothetical protein